MHWITLLLSNMYQTSHKCNHKCRGKRQKRSNDHVISASMLSNNFSPVQGKRQEKPTHLDARISKLSPISRLFPKKKKRNTQYGINPKNRRQWLQEFIFNNTNFATRSIKPNGDGTKRNAIYQPMPSAKADGLLHDAMEADKHRLGAVVSCHHHLGVPRQQRKVLLAALPEALLASAAHSRHPPSLRPNSPPKNTPTNRSNQDAAPDRNRRSSIAARLSIDGAKIERNSEHDLRERERERGEVE